MRILLVASRDPGGRQSGRKAVLATIVAALRTLGHDVRVAAVAPELEPQRPAAYDGVVVVRVPPPHPARIAANLATQVPRNRLSLNEALYDSPATGRRVAGIAREHGSEVVVADTIRTFPLARRTGLPVIADLDDLLSARYAAMARAPDRRAILGYWGERLPRPAARFAAFAANRLLRVEAAKIARRELAVAREAAAVSLVAEAEAAWLAAATGVPVDVLPMAVAIPPAPAPVREAPATSFAFVGGLDYQPNVDALSWLRREVLHRLEPGFRVHVLGHAPDAVRRELAHPALELRGYVDDVVAELAHHRAFLAPIVSGTGIKTKVVEAMAAGLPVVSTPDGVAGLDITPGRHAHVAGDGPGFARHVAELANDPDAAARMGAEGRELVAARFSLEAVAGRWAALLSRIAPATPPAAPGASRRARPSAGS